MSKAAGVDKQYQSQPAPARWRGTYRATRRNEVLRQFKVRWTDMFYSERHIAGRSGNKERGLGLPPS